MGWNSFVRVILFLVIGVLNMLNFFGDKIPKHIWTSIMFSCTSSIYYRLMDKVHTLWVGTLLFRLVDRNGSVSSLQVKIHVLAVSPLLILLFRRHVCLSGRQHILYKPQELSDNKLRLCLQRNWSSQDFRSILASGNQSSMTSTLNMWWSAKIRLATAEPIVLMHFIWHNFNMAIWTKYLCIVLTREKYGSAVTFLLMRWRKDDKNRYLLKTKRSYLESVYAILAGHFGHFLRILKMSSDELELNSIECLARLKKFREHWLVSTNV